MNEAQHKYERVLKAIENNPKKTLRQIATELGISYTHARQIRWRANLPKRKAGRPSLLHHRDDQPVTNSFT